MASIRVVLDERRVLRNGTYPLIIRICLAKKTLTLPTSIHLDRYYWDIKDQKVRDEHPSCSHFNLKLMEQVYELSGKLLTLERTYPKGYTFEQLKTFMTASETSPAETNIRSFWEQEIASLIASKRYGNARTQRISLDAFHRIEQLKIPFEQLNFEMLKHYEQVMLSNGLKTNSIGVYMRSLRVIYNTAINKDVVEAKHYPFRRYRIKSEKVVPHVSTMEEMRSFFNLQIDMDDPLRHAWLLGKLSFLLAGINFHDMILLTMDNIKQGRIIYKRSKTKKLYSLPILPATKLVLDELFKQKCSTICGELSDKDLKATERLPYIIREKNKQFNLRLAKLSHRISSSVVMRSYTFRYTVANLCKQMGYDICMISELLGHNYGSSVTSGYLMAYDKDKLDAILKDVVEMVSLEIE